MTAPLLAILLSLPAGAQVLAPVLPPGRALSAVPPWMATQEPGLEEARDKVLRALALLERSATGRRLLAELGPGKVLIERDGSLMVTDASRTVFAGADFVEEYTEEVLAVQMAHELEHLRQIRLGVTGSGVRRAVRELGAVLVQTRAWVELGGVTHDEHWQGNRANAWDMNAELDYPYSALAAIAARADMTLDLSDPVARRYWEDTWADEAAWRKAWKARFPRGRDSKEAALLALRQAARFMPDAPDGEVSDRLPAAIEAAAAGRPTAQGALSPIERAILARVAR